MVARCVATNGAGRSSDCLPGSRTFGGSWCAMSDSPRTFSGCYTWPAASFCCEVYEMASSLFTNSGASLNTMAGWKETYERLWELDGVSPLDPTKLIELATSAY